MCSIGTNGSGRSDGPRRAQPLLVAALVALAAVLSACSATRSAGRPFETRVRTFVDSSERLELRLAGMVQRSEDFSPVFDGLTTLHVFNGRPIVSPRGAEFHDALVAFNADVPAGDGLRVELRVSPDLTDDGVWSPWLTLATWGESARFAGPVREFALPTGHVGKIDIDYFTSPGPRLFRRLQYRVLVTSPRVRVSLISVAFDNEREWIVRSTSRVVTRALGRAGDPTVPFRTQKTPDAALSGRLCSPTSVAMVLAHHGVDVPVASVAELARDPEFDLYGNWPRNIQTAAAFGVPGLLTRISDWNQVQELFGQGLPIIASIQVSKGDLPEAPYASTSGHLIVLTGFTAEGDVHVNDPACGTEIEGRRAYSRKHLTNVWLARTGGTAYILLPRQVASSATP